MSNREIGGAPPRPSLETVSPHQKTLERLTMAAAHLEVVNADMRHALATARGNHDPGELLYQVDVTLHEIAQVIVELTSLQLAMVRESR